jgi:hypothetical protein
VAVVAAALLCGWTIYADPIAHAKAVALLRPWVSLVFPGEPEVTFGPTSARRGEIDGQTILYVEGTLRNNGVRPLRTPTLLVTLVGEDGRPLYAWKTKAAAAETPPLGQMAFQTRLLSPPERFVRIEVSLAGG